MIVRHRTPAPAEPGGELQVHGSGTLVRWLLEDQPVDEMTLFVSPVVVVQGTRIFPDNSPDMRSTWRT